MCMTITVIYCLMTQIHPYTPPLTATVRTATAAINVTSNIITTSRSSSIRSITPSVTKISCQQLPLSVAPKPSRLSEA